MIYSEEEKKAIESLNSYINAIDIFGTINPKCYNNLYKPTKTVLNLIKKQQAELNKYKQLYKKALDDLVVSDSNNIKKDKIIDEMATECSIQTGRWENLSNEEIKQYFYRKVENYE